MGGSRLNPLAAARNNAEWCDSLCRTHGMPGRFDADAWVNSHRTPRYYPDAVSLDPTVVAGSILERIDTTSPGCSIKDSFATLDLAPFGFQVVQVGEWIYRDSPTPRPTPSGDVRWIAIETAQQLAEWEAVWDVDDASDRLFLPALLEDPSVTVIGGRVDGAIVAGAIANRTGDELVGLSNVFTTQHDLDGAWSGALAYLDASDPGLAIVGWAAGRDLSVALRRGFRTAGALRIWLKEA